MCSKNNTYFHDQIVWNDNQCIKPVNYFLDYQISPDYDDVYFNYDDLVLNLNDKFLAFTNFFSNSKNSLSILNYQDIHF